MSEEAPAGKTVDRIFVLGLNIGAAIVLMLSIAFVGASSRVGNEERDGESRAAAAKDFQDRARAWAHMFDAQFAENRMLDEKRRASEAAAKRRAAKKRRAGVYGPWENK